MFAYLTAIINGKKLYSTNRSYNKEMGTIYVNFAKALLHNRLNLDNKKFKKHEEIIKFLEGFKGDKLFTRHYISKLKNKGGEFEKIPFTPECKEFIEYVKTVFPKFKEAEFILGTKSLNKTSSKRITKATSIKKSKAVIKKSKIINKPIKRVTKGLFSMVKLVAKFKAFIVIIQKILLLEDIYTGIAFLFIQMPYLVLALLAFLDNPELYKKLTEWNAATVD
jgi:hypothetical protein